MKPMTMSRSANYAVPIAAVNRNDPGELSFPLARMRLGLLGRLRHEQSVPIELFACLCGAEMP